MDSGPSTALIPMMGGVTLINYTDWYGAGGTRSQLARAIATGSMRKIRRGTLIDARETLTRQAQHLALVQAAAPALQELTFVDRTSAAVVHGLPVFAGRLGRVTVLRTGGGHGVVRPLIHARGGSIDPADVEVVEGIAVTGLALTAADLARRLPFPEAVMTVDAALRLGARKDDILARLEGGQGCRRAARAVLFGDSRSESAGESISRAIMQLAGLPIPDLQREVLAPDGTLLARLDFYWDAADLGGEFDGRTKYTDLVPVGSDAGTVIWREKRRELDVSDLITDLTRWVWPELWDGTMCRRVGRKLGVTGFRVPTLTLPPGVTVQPGADRSRS